MSSLLKIVEPNPAQEVKEAEVKQPERKKITVLIYSKPVPQKERQTLTEMGTAVFLNCKKNQWLQPDQIVAESDPDFVVLDYRCKYAREWISRHFNWLTQHFVVLCIDFYEKMSSWPQEFETCEHVVRTKLPEPQFSRQEFLRLLTSKKLENPGCFSVLMGLYETFKKTWLIS